MHRFPRRTAAAVAAALTTIVLSSAGVRAQSAKVLPGHAATTEGNSSCYFPFLYDACRAQVIWQAQSVTAAAAVLNSIDFRRDTSKSNYAALSLSTHVVTLGPTSVAPAAMSKTYAANITGKMTTVVNGKYSIAALPAPNPGPAPFAIKYPLSTPFIYLPSQGNLLLDWTTGTGSATSKMDYQLDAVTTATSGGYGFVRQFGSWGTFAGNDPASWKADASKLVPGGSADLAFAGFKQGYASNLIVGLSDTTYNGVTLPFDLGVIGASGNNLYASMDVILPFSLTQSSSGTWTANPSFSLPKDNRLIGLSAFVQSYYLDSKANVLGLVASDAMELTIGSAGPIGNMVGSDGANSTAGGVMNFLPVVQFAGSIK